MNLRCGGSMRRLESRAIGRANSGPVGLASLGDFDGLAVLLRVDGVGAGGLVWRRDTPRNLVTALPRRRGGGVGALRRRLMADEAVRVAPEQVERRAAGRAGGLEDGRCERRADPPPRAEAERG